VPVRPLRLLARRARPHGRHPTRTGRLDRVVIVAHWPLGLARVAWRYLWRTTPMRRGDVPGGPQDVPDPVPRVFCDERIQLLGHGVGPMLHRRYTARVTDATATAEELVGRLAANPNEAAPRDAAVFVKTHGEPGTLRPGDEFVVRMPGPWDGPVRVIETRPRSFRLATLRGHLEAGQIEFRVATADGPGELLIEIESWARPGDRLSHLLYNRLLLAKEVQLNLWVETLMQLIAHSGGRRRGALRLDTRWLDAPSGTLER
jgi:hypothetical protein